MEILKPAECPSLSGSSILTYRIGRKDKEIYIALTGNSGGGHFSPDWVSLEEIYSILSSQKKPVTSGALQDLYQGKSSNNASFTAAILLSLGVLKVSPGNKHYDLVGQTEFQKIVKGLIEAAPEEKPKKKSSKKGKEVNND
jgi:hypothetical protein